MSGLFKTPKIPKPEKPIPMPDAEEINLAKRRNQSKRMNTGRTSTILSDSLG